MDSPARIPPRRAGRHPGTGGAVRGAAPQLPDGVSRLSRDACARLDGFPAVRAFRRGGVHRAVRLLAGRVARSQRVAPGQQGRSSRRRRAWRILPPYWPALVFSLIIAWTLVPQPGDGVPTGKSVVVYGLLLQDVVRLPQPQRRLLVHRRGGPALLRLPAPVAGCCARAGAAVMLGVTTGLWCCIGAAGAACVRCGRFDAVHAPVRRPLRRRRRRRRHRLRPARSGTASAGSGGPSPPSCR